MSGQKEWREVLDAEVHRWSTMTCSQIVSELDEVKAYEVHLSGMQYQVEVELLEDTRDYLHVMVAVDDGSLPASMLPLASTFVLRKSDPAS
ncbi:MAG: hypothetical protein KIT83_11395 [Bryobacterales bacterium]|nr:hypothetical protein [Bryobacterales bacterium]